MGQKIVKGAVRLKIDRFVLMAYGNYSEEKVGKVLRGRKLKFKDNKFFFFFLLDKRGNVMHNEHVSFRQLLYL